MTHHKNFTILVSLGSCIALTRAYMSAKARMRNFNAAQSPAPARRWLPQVPRTTMIPLQIATRWSMLKSENI